MSVKNLAKLVNLALDNTDLKVISSTIKRYRDNFFAKTSRKDKELSRGWTNIPLLLFLIISLYRYYTKNYNLDKKDLLLGAFCILGWVTIA